MEENNKVVYLNADKVDEQDFTAEQTQAATEEISLEKATKLFKTYGDMNIVKKMRAEMNARRADVVGGNSELADKLSNLVSGMTPDQVRELSDEAVNEIYTDENGEIEIVLDLDDKAKIEYKRDFLVFLRETDIANEQFEKEADALEAAMEEHKQEMNELISQFGDLSTFMRTKLQEEYDDAEGTRKEKLAVIIDAYDDSYTLDRVVAHYEKFGVQNTISDYYHRADNVFERYVKVIRKLNVRAELTSFENLEVNLLEEKYHVHPNLFLFAVIKMYAYKKDATANNDGVFLSQLAVNLKSLYADSFGDESKKETFKAAIRKVLDLFLGE